MEEVFEAAQEDIKKKQPPQEFDRTLDGLVTEDLYHIIIEKTSGEARLKAENGVPGSGWHAYMTLVAWYATASGQAIQERTRIITNPPVPKNDESILHTLESWIREVRVVEQHGDDYKLPDQYKITALGVIMAHKQDKFDQIHRQRNEHK